ncbi:MAG TPA: glycosyltransferase family 2 protein [Acidobacteriota bacterium]|nr:glycosyltransferase family 2 protein [Acidobacteriota bacterium]
MKKISAVLISFNEEEKIEDALSSLRGIADEIIVVDSFSSDRTPEICRRFTEHVIQREWPGYRAQKQFATDQASHPWVLSLDCDERLSADLRSELRDWKRRPEGPEKGYAIPRQTYFMGRWIRHTTWYPDLQMRLFRPDSGRWRGGRVHESFRLKNGTVQGRLGGHILHFTYSDLSEYLGQLDRFSSLAAADYLDRGKGVGPLRVALTPPLVFLKNYILRRGFLDGRAGLAVSFLSAVSVLFKHLKLWELRGRGPKKQRPRSNSQGSPGQTGGGRTR